MVVFQHNLAICRNEPFGLNADYPSSTSLIRDIDGLTLLRFSFVFSMLRDLRRIGQIRGVLTVPSTRGEGGKGRTTKKKNN